MIQKSKTYRDPSEAEWRAIYALYSLLYDNGFFTLSKKRSVFTALLGYEVWSWRVVGITVKAVIEIHKNDYKYPTRVLVRDHHRPRKDTYNAIFLRKYEFNEWWAFIWDNDETILMTNAEHNAKDSKEVSPVIPIDPRHSFFIDKEVAGFYYTKGREGKMVKDLFENLTTNQRNLYL